MEAARILVVDDDPDIRAMLRMMLEASGYAVVCAANAREGKAQLDGQPFDVVLTDLIMPEADGIELLIALRTRRDPARVIVMTGGGLLGANIYLSIARGFRPDWQLSKPFSREELIAAIESTRRAPLPASSCVA